MRALLIALGLAADISPPPPPPPMLVGRIALVNVGKGLCAVDLRLRDGAAAGRRLRVLREGKRIGDIEIVEARAWGSWVRVVGETRLLSLLKGDRVESLP